jgi:hypothetical protein
MIPLISDKLGERKLCRREGSRDEAGSSNMLPRQAVDGGRVFWRSNSRSGVSKDTWTHSADSAAIISQKNSERVAELSSAHEFPSLPSQLETEHISTVITSRTVGYQGRPINA